MKKKNKLLILIHGLKFSLSTFMLFVFLSVCAEAAEPKVSPRKSTNVTIDSAQLEPFSINEKTEPKDKRAVFYSDQNSSVDINDNGEPNLNTRF